MTLTSFLLSLLLSLLTTPAPDAPADRASVLRLDVGAPDGDLAWSDSNPSDPGRDEEDPPSPLDEDDEEDEDDQDEWAYHTVCPLDPSPRYATWSDTAPPKHSPASFPRILAARSPPTS